METAAPSAPTGLLRSASFDGAFVGGVAACSLLLGAVAMRSPAWFTAVLLLDLWLFAYPHVASTWTRLALDGASRRRHWGLLYVLPPVVLAGTTAVSLAGGALALNSLYYYWQSYHYTRQSYGIGRAYQRARGDLPGSRDWLTDGVTFAFPAWGVLHRAAGGQREFYGGLLWLPAVSPAFSAAIGVMAMALLAVWAFRERRAFWRPERRAPAAFLLSHVLLTVVSYVAVADLTAGWLFLNIWHNAQYLLFVWSQGARELGRRPDATRPRLSWLHQPGRALPYALLCLTAGGVFYLTLGQLTTRAAGSMVTIVPLVLVAHLAVNFHHYVVDAVIWRSRPRAAAVALEASAIAEGQGRTLA